MEILENLKTLVEDTVMSNMEQEQNPCDKTLDEASGFSISSDKVVGDNNVSNEVVENVEVEENQVFDGVEGVILSGGVGLIGDGENCWGFGEMERGALVNEDVANESQVKECGLGPDCGGDVGVLQYSYENGSRYEMVQEVCSSEIGIEEVGDDTLMLQDEAIEEVGAENVVMQEAAIEEVGAENVVLQEPAIEEVGTENVVLQEPAIEEVEAEKVIMQEAIKEVGAKNLLMQEGIKAAVEEVGAEKIVMQVGTEEVKAGNVIIQDVVRAENVVMHEGVKDQYVLQQNVVDSGNIMIGSETGISLYVDVFGQVDSGVEGDHSCLVEQGLFGSSSNKEKLSKGNIARLPDDGNKGGNTEVQDCSIYKNAEEKNDVNAYNGYRLSVGDLVWAKTNTQLWWPGVICEHSDVLKVTAKTEHDYFQVRLFGSGNVLRKRTSQLKPFHEYFEQMSRQSSSKSFYCAVDKAVAEIGRRVKLEMTCPCYPEESKISDVDEGGGKMSKEKACKVDELPVLQFEPEYLLARIKCFARDVALPATIEIKVIQNRLSAFYRSIGHHQLPIHQLKPTDAKSDDQNVVTSGVISSKVALKSRTRSSNKGPGDGKDEAICTLIPSEMNMPSLILSTKSSGNKANSVERLDCGTDEKLEKSYESRERRKSKYLSFPYVDPSLTTKSLTNLEGDETADPSDDTSRSARTINSRDKKTKKNPCRKSIGEDISVPDVINASAAKLLSKLRFTALGCLYPDKSKQFDIMQSFVSRFRRFAFRDFTHEVKDEDTVRKDFENEENGERSAPDISKTTGTGLIEKDGNFKSMLKSRKKENTTPLGSNTKPTDGFPGNINLSGSIVIDFQTIDPHASESETVPMKRKRKANKTPGLPEIKVMARLADLKGRNIGAQLEGFSGASACTLNKGKSKPKRTPVNHPMSNGDGMPDENGTIGKVGELAPKQPDANKNTEPSSGLEGIQQTGMLYPDKPELKKRKSKQIAADVTSAIPDLNGNSTESHLQEAQPSEMISIPPEVKPRRKHRKKNPGAGLLDTNLSCGEAQTNGEALGTALLLKFAPEAPMPAKEDLTSTFCIFGPLKDSEAKVFSDSDTAQVVFVNSSDARTAFCSLEKNSPFGPALVNYRLQVLYAASGISGPDGSLNMHQVWPAEKVKSPPKPRTRKKPKNPGKPSTISAPQGQSTEAPDLQFVRQNLQMMTSMLENAGDNISPEMRAKLETEIKSLLNKVTSMVGSSSS